MSLRARTLILVMAGVVLALPALTILLTGVWENHLVRQTEELLIAEAVVVGEIFRQEIDPEARIALSDPKDAERRYLPFFPTLALGDPVRPAAVRSEPSREPETELERKLSALLERTMIRNLSGVRILDSSGRVVASPSHEVGYQLSHLEEVRAALAGKYGAAIRRRKTSNESPSPESLSRAADIRLSIAIPIYESPRESQPGAPIIGVVFNSRTPVDLEKSIWMIKSELYTPLLFSSVVAGLLVIVLSLLIGRPIEALRAKARIVAEGGDPGELAIDGFAPKEVQALSQTISKMRDELESRARYIRDFAENAVHEMKSPLTSLRGATELLLEGDVPPERAKKFIENIHEDSLRLDRLVKSMLELARIEAGAPVRESVRLDVLITDVASEYVSRDCDIRLNLESLEPVSLDPRQVESALRNLLDNAIRYGGSEPVEVSLSKSTTAVYIEVRDHGDPKSAEELGRAFERFYTTDREGGGTGLGLAIVRAVAGAHGGRATFRCHDRGVSFRLELPARFDEL